MIARGRHGVGPRPAIRGRLVHLVGVAGAVGGAAERVQAAVEHRHGQPPARGRHRRPRLPPLTGGDELVHAVQRRPLHAPAGVAADDEEAVAHDGGGGVMDGHGQRGARLPDVEARIERLDGGHRLGALAEPADDPHAIAPGRDGHLLAGRRHRRQRRPAAGRQLIDRRRRVGDAADAAAGERGQRQRAAHEDGTGETWHHGVTSPGAYDAGRARARKAASSSTATPRRRASASFLPASSPAIR